MPHTIGVGVLNVAPHVVWARMDGLPGERVLLQCESVSAIFKMSIRSEEIARCAPELVLEPVERIVRGDANLLNDFLVEVVEQLLLGKCFCFRNLRFKLVLK